MPVPLMFATLSDRREFGDDWLLERTLDGERCIARTHRAEVQLETRTCNDLSGTDPDVRDAIAAQAARSLLLDGEVVAYGRLRYAGKVGTGLGAETLRTLGARLRALAAQESPFADARPLPRGARWTRPELVAQIGFAERTDDGRLRQARFLGLRADTRPEDVVRERPR